MKKFITFIIATPIVWATLFLTIGMQSMKLLGSLNFNGTPMFIQTDEQAMTIAKWVMGCTGLMAAALGAEIAAIVADWDRIIQRMFAPERRYRRY